MIEVYYFCLRLENEQKEKIKLYVSQEVGEFIQTFDRSYKYTGDVVNDVVQRLRNLSLAGFIVDTVSIRSEGSQVFRIRIDNVRIIGFYDKDKFIAISYFIKKGQKPTRIQRDIIDKVAKIKKNKGWEL